MGFECGIVGLPNVGKSTIFNALTSAKAQAENFPFCTIEPNTGIVKVPDPRLNEISKYITTKQIIPTSMTFVDIAGLVKGASKGEGLGNQFLSHIRETNAIAHVVRCFEDTNVVHVDGSVDPVRDLSVIETELILADLETVTKKHKSLDKVARSGVKEAAKVFGVLERVKPALEEGKSVREMALEDNDLEVLKELHLLTTKKIMIIANVAEDDLSNPDANPHVQKIKAHAQSIGAPVVTICGKIEAEVAELEAEERTSFLADLGLKEPGLNQVIRSGYELLGLQTYFTAGEKEVRAWTIRKGSTAPEAAGVIHTDFEKGFIRAEVYHYDDLMKHHSVNAVKDAGLLRVEGKDYIPSDGDVMLFRFNV